MASKSLASVARGKRGRAFSLWALCVCVLITLSARARAHDLAIDQVMLWPDRATGELRGEITFDPELTRGKDAQPTEKHARRVVEFLKANLELTLDERVAPVHFKVRELWVRGGATLGDVVKFSTPLAASTREMRLHASSFKALVVSVQRERPSAATGSAATGSAAATLVETTSWLLGKDEWTPVFDLISGWRAPGWRTGGPDVFAEASDASKPSAADPTQGNPSSAAPTLGAPANGSVALAANSDGREASWAGLAARFVGLGFEHILPGGIDHVLFVAALVLARTRGYREVLISLSLFTLAHTLTLALGNFQLVQVSPNVVEPLIAFSIFVLGIDSLRANRSLEAPASVHRLLVFSFGLVHGLGFASALSQLAFDPDRVVLALFSFNFGVELGQIAVVAVLGSILQLLRRWRGVEQYAALVGSAAIAVSGLVLAVDRVSHVGAEASTLTPAAVRPAAITPANPSL